MSSVVALFVVAVLGAAGCHARAEQPAKEVVIWHRVGTWSGHGNRQTESFTSDSGSLRVQWQTKDPKGQDAVFRLGAHSAISGRELQPLVDTHAAANGTAFVDQDPHVFYMEVESKDVDWSFTVDDAVVATVTERSR